MAKSLEMFRSTVAAALSTSSKTSVILNYHMNELGACELGGHFSPVAAYHERSDSILICDCWLTTEPMWAPLKKVWPAICGVDDETGKPRGLLMVQCREPISG